MSARSSRLGVRDQFVTINDFANRSSRKPEDEKWQGRRSLYQGSLDRPSGKRNHQTYALHEGANIGYNVGDEVRKRRRAQRAPGTKR